MSGILYLDVKDFELVKTPSNQISLYNNIRGTSFILISHRKCKKCCELIPNFKKLPSSLKNCQFGILDITFDRRIIELAKKTILGINYVPYMFICYNGLPIMEYKGDNNIINIRNFIIEVDKEINSKIRNRIKHRQNNNGVRQKTSRNSFDEKDSRDNKLEGIPLYGDMSKGEYMDYVSAYGEYEE